MSSCIDQKYEKMIHAFEINMLKEDDRRDFEQHLLRCQSCFKQVEEFLPSIRLLRHDPDFMAEAVTEPESRIVPKKKWSNITRLLAAAVLIVVLALPIYWFMISVDDVQEIVLLPDRSSNNNTLLLREGGTARISFAVEDYNKEIAYDLIILDLSGDTIFYRQDFTDFNEKGLGSISLPVSEFNIGHYILTISTIFASDSMEYIQYTFRVK